MVYVCGYERYRYRNGTKPVKLHILRQREKTQNQQISQERKLSTVRLIPIIHTNILILCHMLSCHAETARLHMYTVI